MKGVGRETTRAGDGWYFSIPLTLALLALLLPWFVCLIKDSGGGFKGSCAVARTAGGLVYTRRW